jgi:undecaprenyl-diphosphatase
MIRHIKNIDIKVLKLLNDNLRHAILDKIMPLITALGNGGLIWFIASLYLINNKYYRIQGYMIITALVITTILGEGIIKHIIKRARPFAEMIEQKLLISKPITYSFPSGHTASSFAAAGILIAMDNKLSIYAVILALLIAFSRVYLNVHYPTDVVTGIILGLLCSKIVVSMFQNGVIDFLDSFYKQLIKT